MSHLNEEKNIHQSHNDTDSHPHKHIIYMEGGTIHPPWFYSHYDKMLFLTCWVYSPSQSPGTCCQQWSGSPLPDWPTTLEVLLWVGGGERHFKNGFLVKTSLISQVHKSPVTRGGNSQKKGGAWPKKKGTFKFKKGTSPYLNLTPLSKLPGFRPLHVSIETQKNENIFLFQKEKKKKA